MFTAENIIGFALIVSFSFGMGGIFRATGIMKRSGSEPTSPEMKSAEQNSMAFGIFFLVAAFVLKFVMAVLTKPV
jgi:hypothetical protein